MPRPTNPDVPSTKPVKHRQRTWSRTLRCSTLALIGVVLGAADAAASTLAPVRRCQIAKLEAAGDELRARIFCERASLSDTPDPDCLATAAGHLRAAFGRAETRGVCMAMRDAGTISSRNAPRALLIGAIAVEPTSPAAARCAARQLTLAGRAVSDLVRVATDDARKPDARRTRRRLLAVRSAFAADYARVSTLPDCVRASTVAAERLYAVVESAVADLRGVLCPGCGEPPPAPPDDGRIAPVPLRGDYVLGLNAREWILVGDAPETEFYEPVQVVLPPDAPAGAGPLPVPGCALPVTDPSCPAQAIVTAIGESDWVVGRQLVMDWTGSSVWLAVAIGPAGEIVRLRWPADRTEIYALEIGPGPLIAGIVRAPDEAPRPALWRTPGYAYEMLPADGFGDGVRPSQIDASGRIVGTGIEPKLPVLWRPGPDGYRLEVLPLLPDDSWGGALGIDGDVIVGWSGGGPRARAVVWVSGDEGYVVRELPAPAGTRCVRAIAVSGGRIAGDCERTNGPSVAPVWLPGDGAAPWSEILELAPLEDGPSAWLNALSGNLAVGRSVGALPLEVRSVAWRLPPLQP